MSFGHFTPKGQLVSGATTPPNYFYQLPYLCGYMAINIQNINLIILLKKFYSLK